MRKRGLWKKAVSILLASAMIMTTAPVSAAGFEPVEETETGDFQVEELQEAPEIPGPTNTFESVEPAAAAEEMLGDETEPAADTDVSGSTLVDYIPKDTTHYPSIYNEQDITAEVFYAKGTPITITDAGNEKNKITWLEQDGTEKSVTTTQDVVVFGGGKSAAEECASTSVTLSGGTIKSVWGGGFNGAKVTGDTLVAIEDGVIWDNCFGGGDKSAVGGTAQVVMKGGELACVSAGGTAFKGKRDDMGAYYTANGILKLHGGTIRAIKELTRSENKKNLDYALIFGGTGNGYASMGSTEVSIDGVKFAAGLDSYVTAGSTNGTLRYASLTLAGLSADSAPISVLQSINRGQITGGVDMTIRKGPVANLYVGGEDPETVSGDVVNGAYTQGANVECIVNSGAEITKQAMGFGLTSANVQVVDERSGDTAKTYAWFPKKNVNNVINEAVTWEFDSSAALAIQKVSNASGDNEKTLTNNGTIKGCISVDSDTIFNNNGTVKNTGSLVNNGTINNEGTIDNTLDSFCDPVEWPAFENKGTLDNSGIVKFHMLGYEGLYDLTSDFEVAYGDNLSEKITDLEEMTVEGNSNSIFQPDGYSTEGWYTDSNRTHKLTFDANTTITDHVVVYQKLKKDAKSLTLDSKELSIAPGGTAELVASLTPSDAEETIIWSISDDGSGKFKFVDGEGNKVVTPTGDKVTIAAGDDAKNETAEITASLQNKESIKATCTVKIVPITADVPKINGDAPIFTPPQKPLAGLDTSPTENGTSPAQEATTLLSNVTQEFVTAGSADGTTITNNEGSDITDEQKKKIDEAAKDGLAAKLVITQKTIDAEEEKKSFLTAAGVEETSNAITAFMDMSIHLEATKKSNADEKVLGKITELPKPLDITIILPENLAGQWVEVVREHDGQVQKLDSVERKPGMLIISSDKFSTYGLVGTGAAYDVHLDANDGTSNPKVETVVVKQGETLADHTVSTPSRSGYSFTGWYEDDTCDTKWEQSKVFTEDTVGEDITEITLYAGWQRQSVPSVTTYTVTFDSQGGSTVAAISGINGGTGITAPAAPTKEGYDFGGWYKEAACANAWDFTKDKVTANTTLYAKWTEKQPVEPGTEGPDPVIVKLVSKNTNTVKISWTESKKAEGYTLWTRAEGETKYARRAIFSKDKARTYTWKNRKPGTKYYFVVKAWIQDEAGKYVFSEPSKTLRATMKPETARIKTAVIDKDGNLKITLDGAAAGANRYAMCWSKNADFSKYRIGIRTQYTTRTAAKGLADGTYYVRVRSYRQLTGARVYGDWSEIVRAAVK